jgi:lipopolysaccharide transport system ATP-binding protein
MSSSGSAVQVQGLGKRYLMPRVAHPESRVGRATAHLKEFLPFFGRREEDYFWALRDLSFDVQPGEILGILGKNGSGKSTLLKILSGVTQPTTGRAFLRGRVGSLLEVGTGFHPDLTGRENVLMSGALLGISAKEIAAKFDEIVDFSGIEPFIDVPVKRYSSGMYVRLAYAVASMLRTDILILDEVMAVGDAEFREKSQRNIEKVAHDGRAVLFVSHNARAVRSLCTTGLILDRGRCTFQGSAADAVVKYLRDVHHYDDTREDSDVSCWDLRSEPRLYDSGPQVLAWISTHRADGTQTNRFRTGDGMVIRIGFKNAQVRNPYFSILVQNEYAERVATLHSTHFAGKLDVSAEGVVECRINDLRIGEGDYRLMVDFGSYGGHRAAMTSLDCVPSAGVIHVSLNEYVGGIGFDAFQGAVHRSTWSVHQVRP